MFPFPLSLASLLAPIRSRHQPENAESNQDLTTTSAQVPATESPEHQAPTSQAPDSMPPTEFPQFLSLPKELQLLIGKFAASPRGALFLEPGFIMRTSSEARNHISRPFPDVLVTSLPDKEVLLYDILSHRRWVGFRTRFGEDSDKFVANSDARLLLKMTCRLARQVVFEAWKKDIGGKEVASNSIVAEGSADIIWSVIAGKRRKEVAEGLDLLIRDTEQRVITYGFEGGAPESHSVSA